MDIRQLELVDAVARHGNFTRAANELHVAQPAVSAAIRHLEDELGVRLFERTSRHVALTDAGEAFLSGARRVMDEMRGLSDAMREFSQGSRGVLRTSWWHQTDPQMVGYLSDYTTRNPGVEVSIVEWSTSESLAGLRRGELDLAMVALPDSIDLTGLGHTVIRRERYALVVTQDHRLAERDSVSVGDLAEERFIVTRPGTGLRSCFDYVFAGRDVAPQIVIETNALSALLALVADGAGSAILPPTMARQAPKDLRLVTLVDAPDFVLAVLWLEGPHTKIVQRAIDLVRRRSGASVVSVAGSPRRRRMVPPRQRRRV
jgi:LysR family hydrogen peroxide-inducible transcriptional activator